MGGLSALPAVHDRSDVDRRARAGGRAAVLGLLLEGPDPRRRARARRLGRLHGLGARPGRRVRDRRSTRSGSCCSCSTASRASTPREHGEAHAGPRRGPVLDALDGRRPRRRRGLRRLPRDPGGHARHAQLPRADRSRPASRRRAARSSAPRRSRSRSRSSACSPRTCSGGGAARTTRRIAAATAPLERVLQEKFGFDRLYDWAFYRPAAALARGGARLWEQRVVIGSMDARRRRGLAGRAACSRPRSPASCASTRWRSRSASPRSPPGS